MSDLAVTYSFTANTTASASQVNTNYSDIVTYINNRDDGSSTWDNVKISATVTNPLDVTGSGASTEVSINNSASDGDPLLTFKLSGSAKYTLGVDDSDSDAFKIGTTDMTTNQIVQIPTGGNQIQFASGTEGAPGISFIAEATTGFRFPSAGLIGVSLAGTGYYQFASTAFTVTDNAINLGGLSNRWKEVFSVNGTINTSHSSFKTDIKAIGNIPVPQGVYFRWKDKVGTSEDKVVMGFLADDLPKEAFSSDEKGEVDLRGVHLNAVVGILCSAVRSLQGDVKELRARVN